MSPEGVVRRVGPRAIMAGQDDTEASQAKAMALGQRHEGRWGRKVRAFSIFGCFFLGGLGGNIHTNINKIFQIRATCFQYIYIYIFSLYLSTASLG